MTPKTLLVGFRSPWSHPVRHTKGMGPQTTRRTPAATANVVLLYHRARSIVGCHFWCHTTTTPVTFFLESLILATGFTPVARASMGLHSAPTASSGVTPAAFAKAGNPALAANLTAMAAEVSSGNVPGVDVELEDEAGAVVAGEVAKCMCR